MVANVRPLIVRKNTQFPRTCKHFAPELTHRGPEFRRWISGPRVEKGNEVMGSLESGRMERFGGAEGFVECGESGSSAEEKSAPPAVRSGRLLWVTRPDR
ncbi:hypothetical protein B5G09_08165 [Alistipes sp. An54]|nr:hypothetical protein B5G09_08165 [Alistipes sp. An54]